MAKMGDWRLNKDEEISLDGIGGVNIVVKADVHRSGTRRSSKSPVTMLIAHRYQLPMLCLWEPSRNRGVCKDGKASRIWSNWATKLRRVAHRYGGEARQCVIMITSNTLRREVLDPGSWYAYTEFQWESPRVPTNLNWNESTFTHTNDREKLNKDTMSQPRRQHSIGFKNISVLRTPILLVPSDGMGKSPWGLSFLVFPGWAGVQGFHHLAAASFQLRLQKRKRWSGGRITLFVKANPVWLMDTVEWFLSRLLYCSLMVVWRGREGSRLWELELCMDSIGK